MSSYLYYYRDAPVFTDGCFNLVARQLVERWASISHIHRPAAA